MKKVLCITVGAFLGSLTLFNYVTATDFASTDGAKIEMDTSGQVAGSTTFSFTPSSQVNIDGESNPTTWGAVSWHSQALDKTNGQGYGMIHNSARVFFRSLEGVTSLTLPGTQISDFTGWVTNQ